jgi:hypothetical protein
MVSQWKIALSLAIVGALAAPFAFHTYKAEPQVSGFVALTAEQREDTIAYLARLNNCREFETIPMDKLPRAADECFYRRGLLQNGKYYSNFSAPKYLALNVVAAVAGFVGIFGLAMVLPALVRRYWRWLRA